MSEQLAISDVPYRPPEGVLTDLPGQLGPNLANEQPQSGGGEYIDPKVANATGPGATGGRKAIQAEGVRVIPRAEQAEQPAFGPFSAAPNPTPQGEFVAERTGGPDSLAFSIHRAAGKAALGAVVEAPKPVVPEQPAPVPAAETQQAREQLRQTFMDQLSAMANGASLEGMGYEGADLHMLEYAVKAAADRRYYGNDTSALSLGELTLAREREDKFEQLGITDLSDEAVAGRASDEAKYLELNGQLYAEAAAVYGDDELRAAGYHWASADELFTIVAAAKRGGKPALPNLELKRQKQREHYAAKGHPTHQDYLDARVAIGQMYVQLQAGAMHEQDRRSSLANQAALHAESDQRRRLEQPIPLV